MTVLKPAYLVVGVTGVARLDLTDAIQRAVPEAEICVAQTMSDAIVSLPEGDRIVCAFVSASPSAFKAAALGGALASSGARIVLMGQEAEDEVLAINTGAFTVLHRPYSAEDILAALEISD